MVITTVGNLKLKTKNVHWKSVQTDDYVIIDDEIYKIEYSGRDKYDKHVIFIGKDKISGDEKDHYDHKTGGRSEFPAREGCESRDCRRV